MCNVIIVATVRITYAIICTSVQYYRLVSYPYAILEQFQNR